MKISFISSTSYARNEELRVTITNTIPWLFLIEPPVIFPYGILYKGLN